MNALITGATGLLGGHLIARLLQQYPSIQIIAAKRPASNIAITQKILSYYFHNPENFFQKIQWIDVDFFNPQEIQEVLNDYGIHQVYHCAGLVSFNDKRSIEILKTNVGITAGLVNVCIDTDIEFCYVSSIAALLNQFQHFNINEKTFWQPGKYQYAYALSKYLGECEVWRGIEEGLNAVIVNPGIIVGAGNWNSGWGLLVKKSFNRIPFYTTGTTGYVSVEDTAEIMIKLMQQKLFGQRFVVVENNYTFKEILEELHLSLQQKPPTIEAKLWMLELARYAESLYSLFNKNYEPNFTKATVNAAVTKNTFDHHLIQSSLNFQFTPVKEYIHKVSQLYLKEKTKH